MTGAAVLLLALQFVFAKLYQKREGTAVSAALLFILAVGAGKLLLFLVLCRFHPLFQWVSFGFAAAVSALCMLYTLFGFALMQRASVSLYTLFLMAGGMTLPYLYGVFFLSEPITLWRSGGLLLVFLALVLIHLPGMGKGGGKAPLLCAAVFVLNGLVSICSKTHQIWPGAIPPAAFSFYNSAFDVFFAFTALLILRLSQKNKAEGRRFSGKTALICCAAAVLSGISFLLQLNGASHLPASVLYPLVTGGTVVLTAVFDGLFFRTKPSVRAVVGLALCLTGTLLFL